MHSTVQYRSSGCVSRLPSQAAAHINLLRQPVALRALENRRVDFHDVLCFQDLVYL